VRDAAKQEIGAVDTSNKSQWHCPAHLAKANSEVSRIGILPIYATDSVVRRADALQKTADAIPACIFINADLAKQVSVDDEDMIFVTQNKVKLSLRVHVDNSIPDNCAVIPQGVPGVESFDAAYADIKLSSKG
jgi:NADH-quinone oxidoreductase subunit G